MHLHPPIHHIRRHSYPPLKLTSKLNSTTSLSSTTVSASGLKCNCPNRATCRHSPIHDDPYASFISFGDDDDQDEAFVYDYMNAGIVDDLPSGGRTKSSRQRSSSGHLHAPPRRRTRSLSPTLLADPDAARTGHMRALARQLQRWIHRMEGRMGPRPILFPGAIDGEDDDAGVHRPRTPEIIEPEVLEVPERPPSRRRPRSPSSDYEPELDCIEEDEFLISVNEPADTVMTGTEEPVKVAVNDFLMPGATAGLLPTPPASPKFRGRKKLKRSSISVGNGKGTGNGAGAMQASRSHSGYPRIWVEPSVDIYTVKEE